MVMVVGWSRFDADLAVGEPWPKVALQTGLGETVASEERPAGVVPAARVDPGPGEGFAHPRDYLSPKQFRPVENRRGGGWRWIVEEIGPSVVLDQPVDALGVLAFENGRGVGGLHPCQNPSGIVPPADGRQQRHRDLVLAGSLAGDLRRSRPDRSGFRR